MRRLALALALSLGIGFDIAFMGPPAWAGDLSVTLTGVSADPGTLHVALWNDPDAFRDDARAVGRMTASAAPGDVTVVFPDVTPGTYALMAYHDADGDGQMDRFLGMIPTEGYALSNDPEGSGPPAFEACAFTVGAEDTEVTARLRY